MSNQFLGGGDDTKFHLLAGFETVDDITSGSGSRQGAGFSILQAAERVRLSVSAAVLTALRSNRLEDATVRPGREVA